MITIQIAIFMRSTIFYSIIISLMMVLFSVCHAFDPVKANQDLDTLSVVLSTQELSSQELQAINKNLIEQKKLAEQCIDEKGKELTELKDKLPDINSEQSITLTADQQFLLQKKQEFTNLVSACKLFSLRASELMKAFGKEVKAAKKSLYFTPTIPLYQQIPNVPSALSQWIADFQIGSLSETFSLESYSVFDLVLILVILAFSFLIGVTLRSIIQTIKTNGKEKNKFEKYFYSLVQHIKKQLMPLLCLSALFAYEGIHDAINQKDLLFDQIILPFLLYNIALIFIYFATSNPFAGDHFYGQKKTKIRRFRFSLELMLLILLGRYFIEQLSIFFPANDLVSKISDVTYYSLVGLVFAAIVQKYLKLAAFFNNHTTFRIVGYCVNYLIIIAVFLALWDGYTPLGKYMLHGYIFSIVGTLFTLISYLILAASLESFILQEFTWQKKAFKLLHLTQNTLILEFITLKLTLFLLLWGGLVIFLNHLWSLSDIWSITFQDYIISGFTIAEIKVQPLRIVFALLFFSLLTLIIKLLKNQLQPKETAINKPAQEAYVIIFGYLAVGLAILFSLMIAGVNMGGLAIIAGALSFGIGFGLQNIVNNFISGLILLLERPIKKGDRIVVGDKEGFVTEVGVRSTHIQMLEHSHVIVPNSDLITKEVKNFMMNNKRFRLKLEVAVKHDCSPKYIKDLLLQAAHSHKEVIKEGPTEPKVFYQGFYNSALNFMLWCSIDNVNNKIHVTSDLYFMIDEILRAHNIAYAFTQADVHLHAPTSELKNLQLQPPSEK